MVQQIQTFLTMPELPDVISYIFIIGMFVFEYFVKLFVKKNNRSTLLSVDMKMAKLNKMEKNLEEEHKALQEERLKWETEREEIKNELETIKKAIRTSSGNSHELVANGTAHQVAEMLPLADDKKEVEEHE